MPTQPGIANPTGAFGLPLSGTNLGGSLVLTGDGLFLEVANNAATANSDTNNAVLEQYGIPMTWSVGSAGGLNGLTVNYSATAHDKYLAGVVYPSGLNTLQAASPTTGLVGAPAVAINAPMIIQIRGIGRVYIGSNTVGAGAYLEQSGTAGIAQVITTGTAVTVNTANGTLGDLGSIIGFALEAQSAKDSFNTIRAKLMM